MKTAVVLLMWVLFLIHGFGADVTVASCVPQKNIAVHSFFTGHLNASVVQFRD
jgi:hypothetical protein